MSKDNISHKPFEEKNIITDTNVNTESNTDIDTHTDTSSDEYVDLSNMVEQESEHIFQFHINLDNLVLKYIGKSSHAPDVIIKENFGPDSNMSLYNCVYSHSELESAKNEYNLENKKELNNNYYNQDDKTPIELSNLFFPIIKLIEQKNKQVNESNEPNEPNEQVEFMISSFAVKLNSGLDYEKDISKWELYWVKNTQSEEFIKVVKIDKNINPLNIIEKLIEMSLK